ncbi:DinB family protein [bacterium]|nr:DinB family protein [bacterium]
MDSSMQASPAMTIGDQMPWVGMTLSYLEKIAALIPEDKLDWRPADPSGKWSFSLGEIAMHCADSRSMFARTLSGDASEEGYWMKYPEDDSGVWTRSREAANLQEILDSLVAGREALEAWLARPYNELLNTTPGTIAGFEKHLASLREAGKDTADAERRGPTTINRVLVAAACHEAGHRGALQTLLRQMGVNAGSE